MAPRPIIRINRLLKYVRFRQFAARTEGKFQAADIFRLVVLVGFCTLKNVLPIIHWIHFITIVTNFLFILHCSLW